MRILMVTDFYPPSIGGIEQHVQALGAALVARGHHVAVATLSHEGWPDVELDGEVRIYRLRGAVHRLGNRVFAQPDRIYAPPCPDPELTRALRRVVAIERPEIVHGHDWLVRSFLPLKARSGVRLVVSLHYYNLLCAKKTLIYRNSPCTGPAVAKCAACAADNYGLAKGLPIVAANWLMGPIERAAVDMFLPVSEAVAVGSGLVGGRAPFRIIPNFVPDIAADSGEGVAPWVAQLPAEPFMLFVGALRRYKGLHVLLRAYAGLHNPPPLVAIGSSWPDTPATFPANVVVLRNWPHAAVMGAWRRSLFGLAPSVWPEPCPTVVMEAMASGRPVVVSRIGGLPELVVSGENGLVVPPDDAPSLAAAMERLYSDGSLRERMGDAGKRTVAKFQANAVVPRIEEAYRDVTEGRFNCGPVACSGLAPTCVAG